MSEQCDTLLDWERDMTVDDARTRAMCRIALHEKSRFHEFATTELIPVIASPPLSHDVM